MKFLTPDDFPAEHRRDATALVLAAARLEVLTRAARLLGVGAVAEAARGVVREVAPAHAAPPVPLEGMPVVDTSPSEPEPEPEPCTVRHYLAERGIGNAREYDSEQVRAVLAFASRVRAECKQRGIVPEYPDGSTPTFPREVLDAVFMRAALDGLLANAAENT